MKMNKQFAAITAAALGMSMLFTACGGSTGSTRRPLPLPLLRQKAQLLRLQPLKAQRHPHPHPEAARQHRTPAAI